MANVIEALGLHHPPKIEVAPSPDNGNRQILQAIFQELTKAPPLPHVVGRMRRKVIEGGRPEKIRDGQEGADFFHKGVILERDGYTLATALGEAEGPDGRTLPFISFRFASELSKEKFRDLSGREISDPDKLHNLLLGHYRGSSPLRYSLYGELRFQPPGADKKFGDPDYIEDPDPEGLFLAYNFKTPRVAGRKTIEAGVGFARKSKALTNQEFIGNQVGRALRAINHTWEKVQRAHKDASPSEEEGERKSLYIGISPERIEEIKTVLRTDYAPVLSTEQLDQIFEDLLVEGGLTGQFEVLAAKRLKKAVKELSHTVSALAGAPEPQPIYRRNGHKTS